jgi:hypothetical protein
MATEIIKMRIQLRRDTAANWELYKDVVPADGEPCFVTDKNILKIGDGVTTFENLQAIGGAEISADGKSIIYENGILKLAGFNEAEIGAQPRKSADGSIEWVVPSTETVEGLQTTIAGLQSDVTNLQTNVTEIQQIVMSSDEGTGTLLDRVESLETKMDDTGEGTVDAKIEAKIEAFASALTPDDGKVNTLMELINYIETHGQEAIDMAADIKTLQNLVGQGTVDERIATAVAGKVDAEEGKSLVADTLIAKLEVINEDAQVNKIEEIYLGENLLEIVDKKIVIPVGAGLKVSDEITMAEDGTLGIGKISFSKIVQEESEVVIMDGGSAAD